MGVEILVGAAGGGDGMVTATGMVAMGVESDASVTLLANQPVVPSSSSTKYQLPFAVWARI